MEIKLKLIKLDVKHLRLKRIINKNNGIFQKLIHYSLRALPFTAPTHSQPCIFMFIFIFSFSYFFFLIPFYRSFFENFYITLYRLETSYFVTFFDDILLLFFENFYSHTTLHVFFYKHIKIRKQAQRC